MFKNEPFTDFTIANNRAALEAALADLDAKMAAGSITAAPIINGKELNGTSVVKSIDPSNPALSIGRVVYASAEDAKRAVELLVKGFASWRDTPTARRVEIVRTVGKLLRRDKAFMTALIIREAAKPWREADGDIAEAIDFCDYYADEMARLGVPQRMGAVPGEENSYFYEPRGVAAVIAPWNFPCAIPCGMTIAALVTGNTTILKPSEQTSVIGYYLARLLLEAGIPTDAFAFLPGLGEEVGAALVDHPRVDAICFTGSKAVGLHIIRTAATVREGQRNVKKVVAEMGGKNAIIIDDDADLDEALKGVIQSTFGFAGQKCSACSRLIIVGDAYEPFLARLKEAVNDIIIGEARNPATFLGPVIDQESHSRILGLIEQYSKTHTLLVRGKTAENGYFVPPTVFRDVDTRSPLWREEIFGPVLACHKATTFDHALELANDCDYALTGAFFSRSPAHIEKGRTAFRVGNLYINRGCTGALVYRQPFGGAKMSGIGSKAGGPDYLIQFMEPRTVTENTMRRGFIP